MKIENVRIENIRMDRPVYLGLDSSDLQSSESRLVFVLDRRKANSNEPFVKPEAKKDHPMHLTWMNEVQHPVVIEGNEMVLRKDWIATFSVPSLKGFYGWSGDFSVRFAFEEKRVPNTIL